MRPPTQVIIAGSLLALSALAPLSAQGRASSAGIHAEQSDTARSGLYDLELTTDNGTLTGKLEFRKSDGGLVPVVTVSGHSPETKSFKRLNGGYVLEVGTPSFTVVYNLKFVNDSLHGDFKMSSGPAGTVLGARKP